MKSYLSTLRLLPAVMAAALLLAGCRSSRHAVDESGDATALVEANDAVSRVNHNRADARCIRAKLNLQANSGHSRVSAGGTIKMKRDELIQISIMFMGFVEAGRIELTPDYLYVQNRVSHEYVRTKWKDIKELRDAGIDFYTFQALFWEELFVPGRHSTPTPADYEVIDLGTTQKLTPTTAAIGRSTVTVNFIVGAVGGLIRQTHLEPASSSKLTFDWAYTSWAALGRQDFPERMAVTVETDKKTYELTMGLSGIESAEKMDDLVPTEPSKRYKEVSLSNIISRLLSSGR